LTERIAAMLLVYLLLGVAIFGLLFLLTSAVDQV
jgi:hypothetical protein